MSEHLSLRGTFVEGETSGRGRVLFIDDDPLCRSAVARLLRSHDLQVDVAAGGDEAIAFAQKRRYTAVVSDLIMPRLNGAELIERLRKLQKSARFVVVTGLDERAAEAYLVKADYDALLFKPWDDQELLRSVESEPPHTGPHPTQGRSVLIIEELTADAVRIEAALRPVLDAKTAVLRAASMEEATALLKRDASVSAVLTGLSLPDAQGIDVVLRLSELGIRGPVIVVTSTSDESLLIQAIEAGADEYISKSMLDPSLLGRALRLAARRHRSTRLLSEAAFRDALTGIANRASFEDRLARLVWDASQRRESFLLLFVDVDRFKDVNDAFGHDTGDALLTGIVGRIKGCLSGDDLLARIGGDELAVLSRRCSTRREAEVLCTSIRDSLREPFALGDRELHASVSIGLGLFPEDGEDAAELCRAADLDMYSKKGHHRRHSSAPPALASAAAHRHDERELRKALEANDFRVVYQPIVELVSRQVTAVEALMRWRKADGELALPATFLPALDMTGLINPVGTWILNQACALLHSLSSEDADGPVLSINVTAAQLSERAFMRMVQEALELHAIAPRRLQLELSERVLRERSRAIQDTLTELRAHGMGLCIDDFGIGTSSLTRLAASEATCVKIDRHVVRGVLSDPACRATAAACTALGHSLGIQVTAEGVETEREHEAVRQLGCTHAQGRFYAQPLSSEALRSFMGR